MSLLPLLESFEPRRFMSVVPVLNNNNDGAGSLRDAVRTAAVGDTIDLSQITGTLMLTSGQITIDKTLTLLGSGDVALTIDGNAAGHIFSVNPGSTFTVKDLALTNGTTDTSGGAILNRGVLELDNVDVSNSHAYLFGGGIYSSGTAVILNNVQIHDDSVSGALEADGGGLYMEGGTLTMTDCTFNNNTAEGQDVSTALTLGGPAYGGAIYMHNTGVSTITNCTFGENTASGGTSTLAQGGGGYGGAISINTPNGTTIASCTVAYNGASGGVGSTLTRYTSQGGGIYSTGGGTTTVLNTITALNTASSNPDMVASVLATAGNNLVGIYTGSTLINGLLGDKIGTTVLPLAPNLLPLGNNGGMTPTFALASDSPAVNAGSAAAPITDQRGLVRRDTPDIGAYELNANHAAAIVAPVTDAVAGATYNVPISTADADGDPLTVTSPNLPSFLHLQTLNGVTSLVGTPNELQAGIYRIELDVNDGFQTTATSFKLRVGIVGIDLDDVTGLLRLNGSEFNDDLSITMLKGDPNTVRVVRDGFKRNFPLASVKKIQIYGFAGDDDIYVNVGPTVRASINAGDGNDTVTGGDGNDYISGGAGNDSIYGGGGRDRIDGDAGRDKVFGESGTDTLHGGDGNDYVDGGSGGRNRLFGDDGDDMLVSSGLKDIADGGLGTNTGLGNALTTVIDAVLSGT